MVNIMVNKMQLVKELGRIIKEVKNLSNEELQEELRSAKNLSLWACRNDEGIQHGELYWLFHLRLKRLEYELERRGLSRNKNLVSNWEK